MNGCVGDAGGMCALTGRVCGSSPFVSDWIFPIANDSRTVSDQIFTFWNVPEWSESRTYEGPEVRSSQSNMYGDRDEHGYKYEVVRRSEGSEVRRSEGVPYVMIRGRIIVWKGGGV